MYIEIDFESEEAIYMQLYHQIIMGIATDRFRDGDSLPSVRQLASLIGVNMHTVNKAYTVLKQDGYVKVDRRKGAIINLNFDNREALEKIRDSLGVITAKAICHGISKGEMHSIIDSIYEEYSKEQ